MFNGKYKSIDTIIENILRDADYYNDIDQNDATEWAVRAMGLIGAPLVYDVDVAITVVANYRAELPADSINILAVRDHKSQHTLVGSTDEFLYHLYEEEVNPSDLGDDDPALAEDNATMADKPTNGPFAYSIRNGYVFLDAKEGYIDIMYEKYPTDADGCLLVPDEERYLLAIETYIIHKLDNKLYRRGVLSKSIRDASEQEWLWYVASAHSKIVTPSYDQAESLKNQILKIHTDSNAHDYGYKHLKRPTRNRF